MSADSFWKMAALTIAGAVILKVWLRGSLFEEIRERAKLLDDGDWYGTGLFFNQLLRCDFCLSVWIGALMSVVWSIISSEHGPRLGQALWAVITGPCFSFFIYWLYKLDEVVSVYISRHKLDSEED